MSFAQLGAMLLCILLSGCVTKGPLKEPAIPGSLASLFKGCSPADGGVVITIREGDSRVGSGELEWIAKPGAFDAQLTGPLGQTFATLRARDGKIAHIDVTGELQSRVPRLKVLKHGYLEVDGHFVGLKLAELPCIFQAAMPAGWSNKLVATAETQGALSMQFEDQNREMALTIEPASTDGTTYCTEIDWSVYLVFTRSLKWCVTTKENPRSGVLQGLGAYTLEWNKLDEQSP